MGRVVRASYFSTAGKIVFGKTIMGFNVLGRDKTPEMRAKLKIDHHSPTLLLSITKEKNQTKPKRHFKMPSGGASQRSEVNGEEEIPGPPLNLRSFT